MLTELDVNETHLSAAKQHLNIFLYGSVIYTIFILKNSTYLYQSYLLSYFLLLLTTYP